MNVLLEIFHRTRWVTMNWWSLRKVDIKASCLVKNESTVVLSHGKLVIFMSEMRRMRYHVVIGCHAYIFIILCLYIKFIELTSYYKILCLLFLYDFKKKEKNNHKIMSNMINNHFGKSFFRRALTFTYWKIWMENLL